MLPSKDQDTIFLIKIYFYLYKFVFSECNPFKGWRIEINSFTYFFVHVTGRINNPSDFNNNNIKYLNNQSNFCVLVSYSLHY